MKVTVQLTKEEGAALARITGNFEPFFFTARWYCRLRLGLSIRQSAMF